MNTLAITQIGDKKDRKYFVKQACTDLKAFVVQGVGTNFLIFDNDKQVAKFKTPIHWFRDIKKYRHN